MALDKYGIAKRIAQELRDGMYVNLGIDRKSTRLNSSHVRISYAVFCLKKKKRALIPGVHLILVRNLVETPLALGNDVVLSKLTQPKPHTFSQTELPISTLSPYRPQHPS